MHYLAETELLFVVGRKREERKNGGGKSPNFPSTFSYVCPMKVPPHRGPAPQTKPCGELLGRPRSVKRETEAPRFNISLLCAGHLLHEVRSRCPRRGCRGRDGWGER